MLTWCLMIFRASVSTLGMFNSPRLAPSGCGPVMLSVPRGDGDHRV